MKILELLILLALFAVGLFVLSEKGNAALVFSDPKFPGITATLIESEKEGTGVLIVENAGMEKPGLVSKTIPGPWSFELDRTSPKDAAVYWHVTGKIDWISPGSAEKYEIKWKGPAEGLVITGEVDGPGYRYQGRACMVPEPKAAGLGLIGSCLLLRRRRC